MSSANLPSLDYWLDIPNDKVTRNSFHIKATINSKGNGVITNRGFVMSEYDKNSDKLDKYKRHLVWVFIDGELLQESLIKKGLAKVAYLYDDYKYTSNLEALELIAKSKRIGIWNEEIDYIKIILAIIIIIIGIILFITNKNFRNKATNKIKKETKKRLKKYFKVL